MPAGRTRAAALQRGSIGGPDWFGPNPPALDQVLDLALTIPAEWFRVTMKRAMDLCRRVAAADQALDRAVPALQDMHRWVERHSHGMDPRVSTSASRRLKHGDDEVDGCGASLARQTNKSDDSKLQT